MFLDFIFALFFVFAGVQLLDSSLGSSHVVLVDVTDHNFQHPEFDQVEKDADSKPGHDGNVVPPVLQIIAYRIFRLYPMDCKGNHGHQTADQEI